MARNLLYLLAILLSCISCTTTAVTQSQSDYVSEWPDSIPWWKQNNLRVIQTNLPAYEGGLHPDSLIEDLKRFSANTLIINAGGIMAFYPTALRDHYKNPHMDKDMLKEVVEKCHANGIKVITRFDFSRAHKSIFEAHPDWFYLSPKGERIINEDMYVVSIDAPYEQQVMFDIVEEVINMFPVDGIFLNMPGYQTRNPYVGVYHGIDQNEYSRKAFAEFSGGMTLPTEENADDPAFIKYEAFKKHSVEDLMKRLHALVKGKNRNIAICTYMDKYVDIIRHESQTNSLPYWPYNASDNVSNAANSYPEHIISNASIQQISFQSRYNAIEPEEVAIRLYENIANGSGLDLSLMGDFQDYEDERNYEAFERVYGHHKKFEAYYGNYTSVAKVVVIAPGAWPGGEAAQEYRGIQLMLKEAHIQYDIIENARIEDLEQTLKKYRLVIMPEINRLDGEALAALERLSNFVNIIATNRTLINHPEILKKIFGATISKTENDGSGYYLSPEDKAFFKRFDKQKLLLWKFNLGFYEFPGADVKQLPIYTPGIPGPPEIIGGHKPTGFYGLGITKHGERQSALIPMNLGRLYYLHGYEQHKNILLDLIDNISPDVRNVISTNAPERVEVIAQAYTKNIPENYGKVATDGLIVHLVNLTGFSGNTYFAPLPVNSIDFSVALDFKPKRIFSMITGKNIESTYEDGKVRFSLSHLGEYDGIVIEK